MFLLEAPHPTSVGHHNSLSGTGVPSSCELIRGFNTLWQGAWWGRYMQSWLTTCMAEWRVHDLEIGRTNFREGDVTLRAGVVPTCVIGCCGICNGKRPRVKIWFRVFVLTHEPVNHEP